MNISINIRGREKPILYSLEHRPMTGETIKVEIGEGIFFVHVNRVIHEDQTKYLVLLCDNCSQPDYKLYPL